MKTHFMGEALRLARHAVATQSGGPFGAVVVEANQIIGCGFSRTTGSSEPGAHAIIMAIRDACRNRGTFNLAGCELYSSCEPCASDMKAVTWAGITRVYYANNRGEVAGYACDCGPPFVRQNAIEGNVPIHLERCMAKEGAQLLNTLRRETAHI